MCLCVFCICRMAGGKACGLVDVGAQVSVGVCVARDRVRGEREKEK